jgi:hypothetical protein
MYDVWETREIHALIIKSEVMRVLGRPRHRRDDF